MRFEITGAPARQEIWDYPLVALREAVTNAICHRDYGNVADIQIKIFEDSLQIWSPGFLPFDLTVEDLLSPTHASSPRNKLIAQVFFDMGLIERYGSGIHRILNDCRDAGLPAPLFENFSGGFRILLKAGDKDIRGEVTEGVTEGVTGLLNLIAQQPGIRTPALAEKMGTSPKNVERWLKQIKAAGHIEFRGATKTGGYYPCTH